MKTSMIAQMAVLAFAFNVTAGPINARYEDELVVVAAAPGGDSDSPAESVAVAARKEKSSETSETKKPKASKASKTKKPKSSKAPKSKAPKATAAPGGGSGDENGGGTPTDPAGNGTTTTPGKGGSSTLSSPMIIAAGGSFDGGGATFGRGVKCTGQAEGGDADAVFILESGASLSNVVIGADQIEGIHCNGGCKLTNIVWEAVCEDALTIKKQTAGQTTTLKGGSAKGASDKVFQHNGAGTFSLSDFTVSGFGKLYRACGNCKASAERHVIMDGITASSGDMLAGINSNFGDTAKITNSKLSGVKSACTTFKGVSSGSEPTKIGDGGQGCTVGADVVRS